MIIVLNVVSCLLHLPIIGQLLGYTQTRYTKEEIRALLRLELGIMMDHKANDVSSTGNKVQLTWSQRLYHTYVASQSYV